MTPDPYIRAQLAVSSALILLCIVLGSVVLAAVLVLALAAGGTSLRLRYQLELAASHGSLPTHRRRLDEMVASDLLVASALLGFALLVELNLDTGWPEVLQPFRVAAVALAAASLTSYLSSLIDWFVVIPRISGQLGPRPCKDRNARFASLPRTWKETTRWWYAHRAVTTFLSRIALSIALANVVGHIADLGLAGKGMVAAVTALASVYVSTLPWAVKEAIDPRRYVGETIRVGTIEPPRFRNPFKAHSVPELKGRFYVVDVDLAAMQLVKLRPLERRAETGSPAASAEPESVPHPEFVWNPSELPVQSVKAASPAGKATKVCAECCGGVNWYCIENPLCYTAK